MLERLGAGVAGGALRLVSEELGFFFFNIILELAWHRSTVSSLWSGARERSHLVSQQY